VNLTPQEMAKDCWVGLELGPGWEKRLTAAIAYQIELAIADEQERCATVADEMAQGFDKSAYDAFFTDAENIGSYSSAAGACLSVAKAIRNLTANQEPAP